MPAISNPKWQRDELILALDLYFRCKPSHINSANEDVLKLSQILNALPIHQERPDVEKFRNSNGVYMKLCNFLRLDPNYHGVGLQRGGKLEEQIWNEFAYNQTYLHQVAGSIIYSLNASPDELNIIDAEEDEFPEGKVLYRQHRTRERNRRLIQRAKEQAMRTGQGLKCKVCGFDFFERYGELGKGFIECHHMTPISEYTIVRTTSLKDIALVCSNCHRMLHKRRPWLTIDQLSEIMSY
jgi:5-methylcytosine-specific restriction enzyme A